MTTKTITATAAEAAQDGLTVRPTDRPELITLDFFDRDSHHVGQARWVSTGRGWRFDGGHTEERGYVYAWNTLADLRMSLVACGMLSRGVI